MNLGNKTRTIRARFPLMNTVVLGLAVIFNFIAYFTSLLDNYIFLGIPIKFVIPVMTLGLLFVVIKGIMAYNEGAEIELYERGVVYKDFKCTYNDLIVSRNGFLETITLSSRDDEVTFKGFITKNDYFALRNL